MNALEQARTAYGSAAASIRTPRSMEFDALARISHRLRNAIRRKDLDFPSFVEAIADNRRIWNMFAAAVAESDNELPQNLRARLFYLAEFTEHQSREALAGRADATVLIEINAAVLKGLGASADAAAQAS